MLKPKPGATARKANARRGSGFADLSPGIGRGFDTLGAVAERDEHDNLLIDRVADRFGMSKTQLAQTVGLRPESLQRAKRATAPRTQTRVTEMLEIVGRVTAWAGGEKQAMAWYRAEPIPAFGGRTAEALVKDGQAAAVRDYLDHVATGGFA